MSNPLVSQGRKSNAEEMYTRSGKSKSTAILLALFLPIGSARVYLGYYAFGAIQMAIGIVGMIIVIDNPMIDGREYLAVLALAGIIAVIGGLIDLVRIIRGTLLPAEGLRTHTSGTAQQIPPKSKSESAVDVLEKLARLRAQGALTEEEFQTKKAEILKNV